MSDNAINSEARASQYLVEKCESLQQAIRFFGRQESNARGLVLLAQIDFWHWEMENLIFSFETFAERSKAWRSKGDLADMVGERFMVDESKVRRTWYGGGGDGRVRAPWEELAATVVMWNDLLSAVESRLMPPRLADRRAEFGIKLEADLSQYRLAVPAGA